MLLVALSTQLWPKAGYAQSKADKEMTLQVPSELIQSGLFDYILPRFKLKTQIKIELAESGGDVVLAPDQGEPVLQKGDDIYGLMVINTSPAAQKFADWLVSDVGRKTITAFVINGTPVFEIPISTAKAVAATAIEGNAILGLAQSQKKCARCHVVEKGAKNSIGSTPSFFVLRGFEDWELRFSGFYLLNPHPAFTLIADVTEAFEATRPAPIVPIELTLDELQAIMAYVQALEPADLGAPLQFQ